MLNSAIQPQAFAPTLEVLLRARPHVADVHVLARFRVKDQQLVLLIVLEVVVRGDGLGAGLEQRVFGDALDHLAAEPDLPASRLQPVQVILAGPRGHGGRG
jgi:hypothetical protein